MNTIFIVGFSGAGKSTVGRRIAERLGMDFADTDAEMERVEGMLAGEIFTKRGEEYFRRLEREALERIAADNCIVATGGGLASWGDNMDWMLMHGRTLYMKLAPEDLIRRLYKGLWKRPLLAKLSGEELREYVERLLAEREQYYLRANIVMDISGVDDDWIVTKLQLIMN